MYIESRFAFALTITGSRNYNDSGELVPATQALFRNDYACNDGEGIPSAICQSNDNVPRRFRASEGLQATERRTQLRSLRNIRNINTKSIVQVTFERRSPTLAIALSLPKMSISEDRIRHIAFAHTDKN